MRIILALLVLLTNIWNTVAVSAEMNFKYQDSRNRQLQVDRYTGYKTNATIEESNPLLVITQINFPSNIKTVYEAIDHALQRSGYRVDWQQSAEAYDIFSELEIPRVHKKLNLMTLKDAVATLAGEAWQLLVDSVNRKLVIQLHNYVPWYTAGKSNGNGPIKLSSKASVPLMTQTRTNRDTINSFMPMQTKRHNFRHEYSGSPLEQSASDANAADSGVSLNSVVPNKLAANPVHFASDANAADNYVSLNSVVPNKLAANPVHFASDANAADNYVSLNSVAPNKLATNPVHFASDANIADNDVSLNSVVPNKLAANPVYFASDANIADNYVSLNSVVPNKLAANPVHFASDANAADNDISLNSVVPNKLAANPVHFASDANAADNYVSLNSVVPNKLAANPVHFASDANAADNYVSLNSVAPNKLATNPVHFASDANAADSDAFVNLVASNELAANPVHFASDANAADSDAFVNLVASNELAANPVHFASDANAADSDAFVNLVASNELAANPVHFASDANAADNYVSLNSVVPNKLAANPVHFASDANAADSDAFVNLVASNELAANPVHFASDANAADSDAFVNLVASNELAANPVHFASDANVADSDAFVNLVASNKLAANPVHFASDANVADSDAFVNLVASNELAANPVHSLRAEISTSDSAESYDEMSNIHRVQYTPGHVESGHTQLSELGEQAPYKGHSANRDLWSVQPIIKAKEGVGSLDEAVIVHYSSISVKDLIEILIPEGWAVHYEVSDAILKQKLVSHAESSRRNALFSLFKELNLKALFYPGQAVVLVAEKEPKSFDYSNFPKFKAIDSREIDAPAPSISNTPEVSKSQPEVDTILQNAKMIKNLMNEMESGFK